MNESTTIDDQAETTDTAPADAQPAAEAQPETEGASAEAPADPSPLPEAEAPASESEPAAPIPADQPAEEGPMPETAAPQDDKPGSASPGPTPPDLAHWTMIVKARDDERLAEARVVEAQLELKSAKAELDAASEKLGNLIDEAKYPTLWSGSGAPRRAPSDPSPLADSLPAVPAQDDTWKLVRLDSLTPKITAKKLEALAGNNPPIVTLGDLTEWQAAKGDWWHKDIPGFKGEQGAKQIRAATDRYFEEHPDWAKAAAREVTNVVSGLLPLELAEAKIA